MGKYKVFNGSSWLDLCDCNIHMMGSDNNWKLLDPNDCPIKYWDGINWCPIVCEGVTSETEINIWYDNSGSMETSLAPLQSMRDNLLQACLLPIYNNDVALYNERVKVLNMSNSPTWSYNERFIRCLAEERNFQRAIDPSVDKVINLTFADESNVYGYGSSGSFLNTTRTTSYDNDIAYLRGVLGGISYEIKGCAFQINTGPGSYPGFRDLTQATFVDTGVYTPPFNISDYYGPNFVYQLDVNAGDLDTYYLAQVVSALNAVGINITCP